MKKLRHILGGLVAASFIANVATAQEIQKCGTTEAMEELRKNDPALDQRMQNFKTEINSIIEAKKTSKSTNNTVYIIPTVFHILHDGAKGNISDAQVIDQINVLNRDFRNLNPLTPNVLNAFKPLVADCEIEFRLAKLDPQGNCTNGILRHQSLKTYNGSSTASKIEQWPREKYLNVWVVDSIGSAASGGLVLGYALFPPSVDGFNFPLDGIVMRSDAVGTIGSAKPAYYSTLTHEVGHYLGLEHTWGSDNEVGKVCGDDGIFDTPVTKGRQSTCSLYDFSCSSQTVVRSYLFDSLKIASGASDPTPVPTNNANLTYGSFSAVGVSSNSTADKRMAFDSWPTGAADGASSYASLTGAINTGKYYQVTLTPKAGRGIASVNSIRLNFSRNTTGARTFSVRTSRDNYSANMKATITDTSTIVIKGTNVFYCKFDTTRTVRSCTLTPVSTGGVNSLKSFDAPITFRFYGWNAEDAAGTFEIDSVSFDVSGGVIENVENYMDYSSCVKMFTEGQKSAMRASLESNVAKRKNLWQPANLAATGVDGSFTETCAPQADFYTNFKTVCVGSTIFFYDNTRNGTVDSRTWTFDDGTPATSTSLNQSVSFSTPGWKTITLTVSNANGSSTKSVADMIYISPAASSTVTGTYYESFEDASAVASSWIINNQPVDANNASIWSITNTASFYGANSMKLNARENYPQFAVFSSNAGDVDELIGPAMDLTGINPLNFTFKYSASTKGTKTSQIKEVLVLQSSINCGRTWQLVDSIKGTTLVSGTGGAANSNDYTPASKSAWKHYTKTLNQSLAKNNVRFKLKYIATSYSNNLYIDDINITQNPLSIEEANAALNFGLYPNPTNGSFTLNYNLDKARNVSIAVYDIVGNKVFDLMNKNEGQGEHNYEFNNLNMAAGIYYVRLTADENVNVKRLVVVQ